MVHTVPRTAVPASVTTVSVSPTAVSASVRFDYIMNWCKQACVSRRTTYIFPATLPCIYMWTHVKTINTLQKLRNRMMCFFTDLQSSQLTLYKPAYCSQHHDMVYMFVLFQCSTRQLTVRQQTLHRRHALAVATYLLSQLRWLKLNGMLYSKMLV